MRQFPKKCIVFGGLPRVCLSSDFFPLPRTDTDRRISLSGGRDYLAGTVLPEAVAKEQARNATPGQQQPAGGGDCTPAADLWRERLFLRLERYVNVLLQALERYYCSFPPGAILSSCTEGLELILRTILPGSMRDSGISVKSLSSSML